MGWLHRPDAPHACDKPPLNGLPPGRAPEPDDPPMFHPPREGSVWQCDGCGQVWEVVWVNHQSLGGGIAPGGNAWLRASWSTRRRMRRLGKLK